MMMPIEPIPMDDGSGTTCPERENDALKVRPWPSMSVPTREPVGGEILIADPGLQVGQEGRPGRDDRLGGGEPVELAVSTAQEHLGDQEIVAGAQGERALDSVVAIVTS